MALGLTSLDARITALSERLRAHLNDRPQRTTWKDDAGTLRVRAGRKGDRYLVEVYDDAGVLRVAAGETATGVYDVILYDAAGAVSKKLSLVS